MDKLEQEKINLFLNKLMELSENKEVEIFYRGESKESLLGIFKLDFEDYRIDQLAEKLFFYGNKSIYFISTAYAKDFNINDKSPEIFEFIFNDFRKLRDTTNPRTKEFIDKNTDLFSFFFDLKNKQEFIRKVLEQTEQDIFITRNYLLSILHQIGTFTKYKKTSYHLSSSSYEEVAAKFSKGIIIKFWKPKFTTDKYSGIYLFNSFVYPEQKEFSVFTAIFPHYIVSFTVDGIEYYNPYIQTSLDAEMSILFGLDINQKDFIKKLYSETIFDKGVEKDAYGNFKEI